MKKKTLVIVLAVLLLIQCGFLAGCRSADDISPEDVGVYTRNFTEEVKTLEYDFAAAMPELQPIKQRTVFIYKEPSKLSESPELALYGFLGNNDAYQIKSVLMVDGAKEADINDFVFEGQIYHHGWVYFNLTERNLYYNGKIYKLNYDYTFFGEYFWENYKEYKGDYSFGDPLPEHQFFSGTVVETENGYAIKPFEDEPIAALFETVRPNFFTEVGKKVTVEYKGYVMAAECPYVQALGGYEYDPDFVYEKTEPTVLDVRNGTYHEPVKPTGMPIGYSDIDNMSSFGTERSVIIDTFEEFKEYKETYRLVFNLNYGREFFENNSLVYFCFWEGTGSMDYHFKEISVTPKTIHITISEPEREPGAYAYDTGMGFYTFSVAVPKSQTKNCTEVAIYRK